MLKLIKYNISPAFNFLAALTTFCISSSDFGLTTSKLSIFLDVDQFWNESILTDGDFPRKVIGAFVCVW